jgi:hypothetical protein
MDTLLHRWDLRNQEIVNNQIRKHERLYLDFVVSGQPLSELFHTKESDMISAFGWRLNTDYEKRTIREFLKQKPAELETGRTIIYGCSECFDIGCGAITAEIIDTGDSIIWKDFGYENNYSGFDIEDYKHIEQFEFDKQQYLEAFNNIERELLKIPRKKDE